MASLAAAVASASVPGVTSDHPLSPGHDDPLELREYQLHLSEGLVHGSSNFDRLLLSTRFTAQHGHINSQQTHHHTSHHHYHVDKGHPQPRQPLEPRRPIDKHVLKMLAETAGHLNKAQAQMEYRMALKAELSASYKRRHLPVEQAVLQDIVGGETPSELQSLADAEKAVEKRTAEHEDSLRKQFKEVPKSRVFKKVPSRFRDLEQQVRQALCNKQVTDRWGYFSTLAEHVPSHAHAANKGVTFNEGEEGPPPPPVNTTDMLRSLIGEDGHSAGAKAGRGKRPEEVATDESWKSIVARRRKEKVYAQLIQKFRNMMVEYNKHQAARLIQLAWRTWHSARVLERSQRLALLHEELRRHRQAQNNLVAVVESAWRGNGAAGPLIHALRRNKSRNISRNTSRTMSRTESRKPAFLSSSRRESFIGDVGSRPSSRAPGAGGDSSDTSDNSDTSSEETYSRSGTATSTGVSFLSQASSRRSHVGTASHGDRQAVSRGSPAGRVSPTKQHVSSSQMAHRVNKVIYHDGSVKRRKPSGKRKQPPPHGPGDQVPDPYNDGNAQQEELQDADGDDHVGDGDDEGVESDGSGAGKADDGGDGHDELEEVDQDGGGDGDDDDVEGVDSVGIDGTVLLEELLGGLQDAAAPVESAANGNAAVDNEEDTSMPGLTAQERQLLALQKREAALQAKLDALAKGALKRALAAAETGGQPEFAAKLRLALQRRGGMTKDLKTQAKRKANQPQQQHHEAPPADDHDATRQEEGMDGTVVDKRGKQRAKGLQHRASKDTSKDGTANRHQDQSDSESLRDNAATDGGDASNGRLKEGSGRKTKETQAQANDVGNSALQESSTQPESPALPAIAEEPSSRSVLSKKSAASRIASQHEKAAERRKKMLYHNTKAVQALAAALSALSGERRQRMRAAWLRRRQRSEDGKPRATCVPVPFMLSSDKRKLERDAALAARRAAEEQARLAAAAEKARIVAMYPPGSPLPPPSTLPPGRARKGQHETAEPSPTPLEYNLVGPQFHAQQLSTQLAKFRHGPYEDTTESESDNEGSIFADDNNVDLKIGNALGCSGQQMLRSVSMLRSTHHTGSPGVAHRSVLPTKERPMQRLEGMSGITLTGMSLGSKPATSQSPHQRSSAGPSRGPMYKLSDEPPTTQLVISNSNAGAMAAARTSNNIKILGMGRASLDMPPGFAGAGAGLQGHPGRRSLDVVHPVRLYHQIHDRLGPAHQYAQGKIGLLDAHAHDDNGPRLTAFIVSRETAGGPAAATAMATTQHQTMPQQSQQQQESGGPFNVQGLTYNQGGGQAGHSVPSYTIDAQQQQQQQYEPISYMHRPPVGHPPATWTALQHRNLYRARYRRQLQRSLRSMHISLHTRAYKATNGSQPGVDQSGSRSDGDTSGAREIDRSSPLPYVARQAPVAKEYVGMGSGNMEISEESAFVQTAQTAQRAADVSRQRVTEGDVGMGEQRIGVGDDEDVGQVTQPVHGMAGRHGMEAAGVNLALRVRDVGWLQGVKVPYTAVQSRIRMKGGYESQQGHPSAAAVQAATTSGTPDFNPATATAASEQVQGTTGTAAPSQPAGYLKGGHGSEVQSRRLVVLRSRRQRDQRRALHERQVEVEAHKLLQPVVNMLLLGPTAEVGLGAVSSKILSPFHEGIPEDTALSRNGTLGPTITPLGGASSCSQITPRSPALDYDLGTPMLSQHYLKLAEKYPVLLSVEQHTARSVSPSFIRLKPSQAVSSLIADDLVPSLIGHVPLADLPRSSGYVVASVTDRECVFMSPSSYGSPRRSWGQLNSIDSVPNPVQSQMTADDVPLNHQSHGNEQPQLMDTYFDSQAHPDMHHGAQDGRGPQMHDLSFESQDTSMTTMIMGSGGEPRSDVLPTTHSIPQPALLHHAHTTGAAGVDEALPNVDGSPSFRDLANEPSFERLSPGGVKQGWKHRGKADRTHPPAASHRVGKLQKGHLAALQPPTPVVDVGMLIVSSVKSLGKQQQQQQQQGESSAMNLAAPKAPTGIRYKLYTGQNSYAQPSTASAGVTGQFHGQVTAASRDSMMSGNNDLPPLRAVSILGAQGLPGTMGKDSTASYDDRLHSSASEGHAFYHYSRDLAAASPSPPQDPSTSVYASHSVAGSFKRASGGYTVMPFSAGLGASVSMPDIHASQPRAKQRHSVDTSPRSSARWGKGSALHTTAAARQAAGGHNDRVYRTVDLLSDKAVSLPSLHREVSEPALSNVAAYKGHAFTSRSYQRTNA